MRSVSLHPIAIVLLILRVAAVSAWLVGELHWGSLMAGITAVLGSLYFPLVATILGCIGAVQVWGWPIWVAVLVFLPGLVLSIAALLGIGAAGLGRRAAYHRGGAGGRTGALRVHCCGQTGREPRARLGHGAAGLQDALADRPQGSGTGCGCLLADLGGGRAGGCGFGYGVRSRVLALRGCGHCSTGRVGHRSARCPGDHRAIAGPVYSQRGTRLSDRVILSVSES